MKRGYWVYLDDKGFVQRTLKRKESGFKREWYVDDMDSFDDMVSELKPLVPRILTSLESLIPVGYRK
jgi:hypothetical protein